MTHTSCQAQRPQSIRFDRYSASGKENRRLAYLSVQPDVVSELETVFFPVFRLESALLSETVFFPASLQELVLVFFPAFRLLKAQFFPTVSHISATQLLPIAPLSKV